MKKRIIFPIVLMLSTFLFFSILFAPQLHEASPSQINNDTLVSSSTEGVIVPEEEKKIEMQPKVATVKKTESIQEIKFVEEIQPKKEIPPAVSQISSSDIQTILAVHNSERSSVGVVSLSWSSSLAKDAQSWTNSLSQTCIPSHANSVIRKGKGENIWAGYGYDMWNISEMITDWVAEKQTYRHETNTCAPGAMCGHYTQVVWSTTTEVGCGMTTCSQDGVEGKIFVCRYNPAGNISNKQPY